MIEDRTGSGRRDQMPNAIHLRFRVFHSPWPKESCYQGGVCTSLVEGFMHMGCFLHTPLVLCSVVQSFPGKTIGSARNGDYPNPDPIDL